ncbi:MAG: twin-arginine translocase subunit TatC [Gammaproteobacteria bacterium]|nr:twin-arginine translocase subunit TatC [Gammaproteobacteria bacterium]MBS03054.1 twin-arginine translocase subunit TatC [Gammaproteobacteria bacterium]
MPAKAEPVDASNDEGQPLVEHLVELRSRILHALLAVFIVFIPLFYFADELYLFVSEPMRAHLTEDATMIATEVASPFFTPVKLALVLALFISMPYVMHQVWSFVAPGLYKNEKRIALPLLVSSIILFYAGMAFAFYVVFPLAFAFLTAAAPADVTVMTDINRYLDFVLKLFFAFGLAFEIPIAILVLLWSGATDIASLKSKRPYVIVGCFIFGMLLTPPDIISQVLLAIPMWVLFELGLILGRFVTDRDDEEDQDVESAS